ncbi:MULTISPECIES: AraC family transcriptional regulator [unclassified Rhodococcus (in: high G+C Gram-positive bacteria)]|uniref:helix-turn-helix domain-containing protein n=1 Tax=unclassified Rhodococcus (in: high G+C Gram-positive bacteria) TaxID=192944 RepID=UPI0015C5E427|nr:MULTISPECIES: AraC family transcriptional regulator [unclassified Rhodococcus (in: high G+C Gram-positive bacteria)]
MRQGKSVRGVEFTPSASDIEIELTTLRAIVRSGGRREFLAPQRLNFDLLYRVESGRTVHRIDFVEYDIAPGDVVWIHAGQVHEWGEIDALSGSVAMFASHAVGPSTQQLLAITAVNMRSFWTADAGTSAGVHTALDALFAPMPPSSGSGIRREIGRSALACLLLRLSSETDGHPALEGAEVFAWFRAEVEAQFRSIRTVSDYAQRLGYSERTLNRAANSHGTTAKKTIDDRIVLEAKRLLVFTSLSVLDIGVQLGYDDPSNFTSFFRVRTGRTPSGFRQGDR